MDTAVAVPRVEVRCRGGSTSLVDPTRGKFGLLPGQLVFLRPGVAGRILGVGGWPNECGIEKLWVKEDTGEYSIIESPRDVKLIKV